jgi:hypothetical protein
MEAGQVERPIVGATACDPQRREEPRFMLRKVISLTMFFSACVLTLSSAVLYIQPKGRVATWVDWRCMGLPKSDWEAIHTTVGWLFVIAAILHIWQNWKSIVRYLKNQVRKYLPPSPVPWVSLAITALVTVGTYFGWPPMQQVIDLSDYFSQRHSILYGEPPYGHAETSSLATFCRRMELDLPQVRAAMRTEGLRLRSSRQAVRDIAATNGMTPRRFFDVVRRAYAKGDPFAALPATPADGTGGLTLSRLCRLYRMPLEAAIGRLSSLGISASGDETMREIGRAAGLHPEDLYDMLRAGTRSPESGRRGAFQGEQVHQETNRRE